MEKVLSQAEIDAMVQTQRTGTAPPLPGRGRSIEEWNILKAGQIGPVQMAAIQQLHESFALGLSRSLSAYLRVGFDVKLASAEHLAYRELVQGFPPESYVASCALAPLGATAVLQLDHAVAFPVLDLLLGGEGNTPAPARPISSVEEQIIEEIPRIICRELQTAWQVLPLEFSLQRREAASQAERLMASDQKVLALSFEVHVGELRGTLNVAVPAVASYALLRKISAQSVHVGYRGSVESQALLRRRLLECSFEVELCVPAVQVPVREVANLQPGQVLVVALRADSEAEFVVAKQPMFTARIAKYGDRRVAQIQQPVSKERAREAA